MSCDSTTKSTVCVCEGGGGQVRGVPGYVCVCGGGGGGGQVREVPGYVCVCEGERGGGYWWPPQSHMHRQHTCFRTLDTVNFLNGAARAPEGPSTLTHSLTHTHC